jgi:hypothetical protein
VYLIPLPLQADELALHNEYQLRLKDMNYSEQLKEMTEKYTQDLEQSRTQYELLVRKCGGDIHLCITVVYTSNSILEKSAYSTSWYVNVVMR